MQATQRLPYLWDYDLDQKQFQEILNALVSANMERLDGHAEAFFVIRARCPTGK